MDQINIISSRERKLVLEQSNRFLEYLNKEGSTVVKIDFQNSDEYLYSVLIHYRTSK